jgi:tetratricopeptide (TPR) repeat protein
VLAFFCLSLLSKNIAVTLPVVLLVLDVWPLGRMGAGMRRPLMEKLPMFVLAGVFVLIAYIAQGSAIMPVDPLTLWERAIIAIGNIGFYFERLFVPHGLAPFYPVPNVLSFGIREAVIIGACMFIAAFSFLRREREGKVAGAAFLFYLITLFPTLGLVQVGSHLAADRYSYLPLLGPMFLAGLAWGYAFGCLRRGRVALAVTALALVAVMSAGTLKQMQAWKGPVPLWSREISLYPFDPIANLKMGQALAGEGRHREALSYYSNAIMLQPRRALNYRNRARSLIELGRTGEARRDIEAASALGN